MTGTKKLSVRRKPLSARQSCQISPNPHSLTAIMESGMGRSPTARAEIQSPSDLRNTSSPFQSHTGTDFHDHWDFCCASACEFDRLKNHLDLKRDLDSLDHLFVHIYSRNDLPALEEGLFSCDSEVDESLDSVSEGDCSRDNNGPQTPSSYKNSPSNLYQWPSSLTSKSGIPSPPSSYPVTPLSNTYSPSSSLSYLIKPMGYLTSSKEFLSSHVEDMYTGTGITGLVEQLSPVLNSG